MILHSVTPIWAMQQMMAEQSEQPTTVLLSEAAALPGRIPQRSDPGVRLGHPKRQPD